MTIKYIFAKDQSELNKLIKSAVTSAQTMRNKVQIASVAILYHAHKHGDYSKANELIEGLGHGVKRNSLVEFFVKFGGLIIDEEAKCFGGWKGATYIKDNFDAAKDNMWWDQGRASDPFTSYSFEQELKKFIDRADKRRIKASKMTAEDAQKYDFSVSDATMTALLSLSSFDAIATEGEATNDDIIAALEKQLA